MKKIFCRTCGEEAILGGDVIQPVRLINNIDHPGINTTYESSAVVYVTVIRCDKCDKEVYLSPYEGNGYCMGLTGALHRDGELWKGMLEEDHDDELEEEFILKEVDEETGEILEEEPSERYYDRCYVWKEPYEEFEIKYVSYDEVLELLRKIKSENDFETPRCGFDKFFLTCHQCPIQKLYMEFLKRKYEMESPPFGASSKHKCWDLQYEYKEQFGIDEEVWSPILCEIILEDVEDWLSCLKEGKEYSFPSKESIQIRYKKKLMRRD